MRRRRFTFWVIVVITLLAAVISLPENYRLQFSYKSFKIDQTISAPDINFSLGPISIKKDIRTSLGLDLAGGSHLVFEAKLEKLQAADRQQALDALRNTIERRVNFFGIAEANVQTAKVDNSSRVIVELPGVEDTDEAVSIIGKTAQLGFREQSPKSELSGQAESTPSAQEATTTAAIFGPFTVDTGLTGAHLKRSQVQFDSGTGKPVVGLEFNEEGAKLFEEITQRNVGKPVAIFLDNQIVSAPRVQEVIAGGQAVISGEFTTDEAKQLSIQLNAGALPVSVELVEQRNIGPSLGRESIQKSLRAGVFGLFIVALFMVGFYGALGLIATIALVIYGLVSMAIFKLIPVTLTLSGIAGFMLSIGMAVDANILIFERMREEMRVGRPWQQAMELGFGKAWDSIRDANITTLLTTFILFNPLNWFFLPQFGIVRGFALTLAIGVLVGLFTGVVVTRTLMRVFYRE